MLKQNGKLAKFLILAGTLGNALSKWYLIWIFAYTSTGPEAVGEYALILAIGTPVFIAAQLGLRAIFVSSSVRWPWNIYLRLRLIGIFLGSVVLLLYVVMNPSVSVVLGLVIIMHKIAETFSDLHFAKLQFFNRMATLGGVTTLSALCSILVATISAFYIGSALLAIASVSVITFIFGFIASLLAKKREYQHHDENGGILGLLKTAVPVTGAQFFAIFLSEIPVLMIAFSTSVDSAGRYAAAAYLITAANLIGASLQVVLLTSFRMTWKTQGHRSLVSSITKITLKLVPLATLCTLIVGWLGPRALTAIYGEEFVVGSLPLILMSLAGVASVLAYIFTAGLYTLNKYKVIAAVSIVSCGFSLIFGFIILSIGWDGLIMGAAVAMTGFWTRALLSYIFLIASSPKNEALNA